MTTARRSTVHSYGLIRDVLLEKGRQVFVISPNVSVRQAVREMNDHGVGALVVVHQDRTVGIFTERDVLRRVVDPGLDPDSTAVRDVMTTALVTVTPETRVSDAMALMTRHRCRHLPVLDGSALAGMVSIGDITRLVSMQLERENQHLVEYIQGRVDD
jgi:CBS domain-containing protein